MKQTTHLSSELIDGFLVTRLTLVRPEFPAELQGIRLLQLTDFHFGPATSLRHLQRAMRVAAPLSPDILLLTGDYLQLSTVGISNFFRPVQTQKHDYRFSAHRRAAREHSHQLREVLSSITAPLGTFAVLGNHDYSEGASLIRSRLGDSIQWLINSSATIPVGGASVTIGGLDDLRYGQADLKGTLTQMESGISQARASQTEPSYAQSPKVLLSHNPDIVLVPGAEELAEVDLIISGHTHGGQIRLPKVGALMTQTKQKAHVYGLSEFCGTPLYVSNGIGYGAVTLRVQCPPEIVVFEFAKTAPNGTAAMFRSSEIGQIRA